MDIAHMTLVVLCGSLVGFTLGLVGGGGSIMATPLLLYVVGLSPHVAIGAGALAVSVNSFMNFGVHARSGNVRWRSAILSAAIAWPVPRSARRWARHSAVSVCSFYSPL